jgi:broad specificity phosphatase PhoE
MVKLIIVRHGNSIGNFKRIFIGQTDWGLSEIGEEQVRRLTEYLKDFHIDKIYSSDLCRAHDTVKPLADALSLPIHKMKALREVDVGLWEGVLREDVARLYPESYDAYINKPGLARFDGGESFAEMLERALLAVQEIVEKNEGKTVVIATHGGVIRALRTVWEGIPLERMAEICHVPNASVTVVRYEREVATLIQTGYCDYLTEKITEKL